MGYVIHARVGDVNYCVRANESAGKFELISVESDSALSKVFCHPNMTGALNILSWINENDEELASQQLTVQPKARFCR